MPPFFGALLCDIVESSVKGSIAGRHLAIVAFSLWSGEVVDYGKDGAVGLGVGRTVMIEAKMILGTTNKFF